MEFIKAINYTGFNYQCIGEEKAKENLQLMQRKTSCNTVIIVLGALQEEPSSSIVDYNHIVMSKDSDLVDFIRFAKRLGLHVFLKPVVECSNGECRADIDFMEQGVFCEEKWKLWQESYIEFILHYAKIAEKTECELFFIGCRLLKLETMTESWKNIIHRVKQCYHGRLTYEADIYNEENVAFWDELDVIASGGNYSKLYLEHELERLIRFARTLHKPLILTECGCMSMKGASVSPNAWDVDGELSLQEQVDFFANLLLICKEQNDVRGIGIWCWNNRRLSEKTSSHDKRYFIYGKPACDIIYEEWKEM